jgi:hypothetical protein
MNCKLKIMEVHLVDPKSVSVEEKDSNVESIQTPPPLPPAFPQSRSKQTELTSLIDLQKNVMESLLKKTNDDSVSGKDRPFLEEKRRQNRLLERFVNSVEKYVDHVVDGDLNKELDQELENELKELNEN